MAKATTRIEKSIPDSVHEQAQALLEVTQAVAQNRDALLMLLDIVKELHRLGLLEAIHAMLQNSHKIGVIAMEQLNKPGAQHILKNGMNALQFLSSINPAELQPLLNGLSSGVKYASEEGTDGQMGLFGMMKKMRDPEVATSMQVMFNFLHGMGQGVRETTH